MTRVGGFGGNRGGGSVVDSGSSRVQPTRTEGKVSGRARGKVFGPFGGLGGGRGRRLSLD